MLHYSTKCNAEIFSSTLHQFGMGKKQKRSWTIYNKLFSYTKAHPISFTWYKENLCKSKNICHPPNIFTQPRLSFILRNENSATHGHRKLNWKSAKNNKILHPQRKKEEEKEENSLSIGLAILQRLAKKHHHRRGWGLKRRKLFDSEERKFSNLLTLLAPLPPPIRFLFTFTVYTRIAIHSIIYRIAKIAPAAF